MLSFKLKKELNKLRDHESYINDHVYQPCPSKSWGSLPGEESDEYDSWGLDPFDWGDN